MFNNEKIQRFAKTLWLILVLFCVIGIISSKDVVNSKAFMAYVYVCLLWTGNNIINEGIKAIHNNKSDN